MTSQEAFFTTVAKRKMVRPSVRAIVIADNKALVQKPSDEPTACYSFVGGEYEMGDTFESRIKTEFKEETNATVRKWEYLFVVENRFLWNGNLIHGLEHFLKVELDRPNIESRERFLSFFWLDIPSLTQCDLRPHLIREGVVSGEYLEKKHFIVL